MMSNAIGVDATMSQIYVHHEINCAPRHWSEVAEQVQNSSHFENADGNSSLLILISGENLRFLGWDNGTSWDDLGHDL